MSTLAPLDRDDLMRWLRAAYEGGDLLCRDTFKQAIRATQELLAVQEETEERLAAATRELERLQGLLVEAWRLLATDEPQNRHPHVVNRHRQAVELKEQLRPEVLRWSR